MKPRAIQFVVLFILLLPSLPTTAQEEVLLFAEVSEIEAPDRAGGDHFGIAISIDGNRMAIGADQDENQVGSVYLYEKDGQGTWRLATKLLASDGQPGDHFGAALALDGPRLAIGAPEADAPSEATGAAYVFERDFEGLWSQTAKLTAEGNQAGDLFGFSIDLDQNKILVGAPFATVSGTESGGAYVFETVGQADWVQTAILRSTGAREQTGSAVSISNNRAAVLVPEDERVYLFKKNQQGDWEPEGPLAAFGDAISLQQGRLAASGSGRVEIFELRPNGTWELDAQLVPDDNPDTFGSSLSLNGNQLAVGAGGDTPGPALGGAYLFTRTGPGVWEQTASLQASNVAIEDHFGWSVSLDGPILAASAPFTDGFFGFGTVYTFEEVVVSPTLRIEGTCPGSLEFQTKGVTPRDDFQLWTSDSEGEGEVSTTVCEGTALGLEGPTLIRTWQSDFDGEGILIRTLGESQCGSFQVVDTRTCLTSEPAQAPLSPR